MTSMSEAVTIVRQSENEIVGGFNRLDSVAPALASLHKQAWEYAGTPSAEAAEHGNAVRNHVSAIHDLITQITAKYRAIDAATRVAVKVVEEADAKRKADRSRLKV